jgi:two-component system, LuxR family, sensor kinase FixL
VSGTLSRQEIFRATFEQAPVGIAHVAPEGHWLRVNRALAEIIGYTTDELLSGCFQEITHPDDLATDLQHVELLLRGEADRYAIDKRYIKKDGSNVWVSLTVALVRKRDGASDFFVAVIQDITQRKQMEATLLSEESRFRAIFDSTVEAIAILNSKGIVQSVNPGIQRVFGYSQEEVVGRNVRMLIPQVLADEHGRYLARYAATGERAIIGIGREVEGRRKDGSAVAIDLSVAEWALDGETFFTGIMRDLTERRTVEAALRSTEERLFALQNEYAHLARINDMGEMAAAIAHEINQPLTAISNSLSTGRHIVRSSDSADALPKLDELMAAASAQAIRAGEIVRRLRQFVGKGTGERQVERIDALVDTASRLALIDAAPSGIEVERIAGASKAEVQIDPIQLQQVVMNLLRNAVDALNSVPEGAPRRLTIATRVVEKAQTVEIRVADNGPGVSAADRAKIFDPFFTSKAKGMGIGLSICRRLIEAHGGSIDLEESNGTGAAFKVELPLA